MLGQVGGIGNALLCELLQFVQLGQANGCLQVCHALVETERDMAIAFFLPMTTQESHTLGFVRRTFPLIPLLPIGLLLGSLGLSIAAFVKASKREPLPA